VQFKTWPDGITEEPDFIVSVAQIFAPELDILSCEIEDTALKVVCNQTSPHWNYCGGELMFKADAAVVTDPDGKNYSIDQLRQISQAYWTAWQKNAEPKTAA